MARLRRRVAFGNNKGGTGKTFLTTQTAAALSARQRRVLVIDMDPQANATRRLGFVPDPNNPLPTISEAIQAGKPGIAADAIVPCGWDHELASRIDLVPSRYDLENRISEAGVLGAVQRLNVALDGVDEDYDAVLIDCPPSLGHLTQNCFAAANHVIAVFEPEYDAIQGALRFWNFIRENGTLNLGNPGLALRGVVVNNFDQRVKDHTFQLEGVPDSFEGVPVWDVLPARSVVKDASDTASPLHAHGSKANEMVKQLDKIAEKVEQLTMEEAA